jgi:alpha,alpha-trehalase
MRPIPAFHPIRGRDAQSRVLRAFLAASVLALSSATATARAEPATALPLPPSLLYGQLYGDVELAKVFPDSKTFADMEPNQPPQQIAAQYAAERQQPGFELKRFVTEHFTLPQRAAKDYRSDPNQSIGAHIDTLWRVLQRSPDRTDNPYASLLPLPNPYIVPGDRFDEIYYWDSYFIMLGLERDGRHDLALDELKNFATLIDRYGHIPNGNRTYYLSRSQPPFFAAMVALIAQRDGDHVYVEYLPQMEKEYAYWMDGSDRLANGTAYRHAVRLVDGTLLNRFWDDRAAPRDESYREDVETAQHTPQRDAKDLWRNLRAGGETGWDFSSRWFADGKTLASIDVTSLIPIDLNCLLFNLERTLAQAYRLRGDTVHAENMKRRADMRAEAIRRLLWDRRLGAFGDFDFMHRTLTHRLSAATVYPLFFGVATRAQADAAASTLNKRLLRPGGLATTTVSSGQQWDEPNGWAPLQYMAVAGLKRYGHEALAQSIATRWMRNNVAYYQRTGKLVEKYDIESNRTAGGGEYPLQDGFGWTNGVFAALAVDYRTTLQKARPADVPDGPAGVAGAAAATATTPKTSNRLGAR